MGYPMTYHRIILRNGLSGGYDMGVKPNHHGPRAIAGDLRRLEEDSRDAAHLKQISEIAKITPEQAKIVLDWLFRDSNLPFPPKP